MFLRKFRLWSLLPAFIWLLAQMSMSFAGSDLSGPSQDNNSLSIIVLCTHAGSRTVTVAADGSIQDYKPPSVVSGHACKWCQTLCSVDWIIGDNNALISPHADSSITAPVVSSIPPKSLRGVRFSIRAPPTAWL